MNNLLQMQLTLIISKSSCTKLQACLPFVADYLIKREDEAIQWFKDEHHWFKDKLKDETNNTGKTYV